MRRPRELTALAVAVGIGLGACGCGERPERAAAGVERIVLVSIDTLRADHVGCYGAEDAETPALDALAAEGVRFAAAVSPAPLTLPAHATLLTGLDPPQHGVRHNGYFQLGADVPTLAEQLGAAGFATAAFVSAFVLDTRFGLARGFDHYDDRLGIAPTAGPPGQVAERRGDQTVDAALGWLADAPERFFLFVHLYDPHAHYAPPSPFAERFAGRPYAGEIAFADAQLARLRSGVSARWPQGTLWWVTSDHGEGLGEHAERSHSFGVYESTQHVPLIAAGPGLPAGVVVPGVVALADVAPSLLEIAGLPELPGASGVSVMPALADSAAPIRKAAWVETLATQIDMGWSPLLGVRTATHKYVRAPEPELYDLVADPGELESLAATEPALVAELDAVVEERSQGRPVVLSFQPDATERAQLEALGYLQGGSGPAAPDSLGRVGGFDPKRGVAELEKFDELQLLIAQRRGAEALAVYDQLEARGYPMLVFGAAAALQAGEPERAEQEARRALAIMEQPEPWITMGGAQILRGDVEGARHSFEQAARVAPDAPGPLVALGSLAEREGRSEAAAQLYRQARSLPLTSSEAFWRGAALAIEAGRRSEAYALLAEVSQADLREPLAAHRLALAERSAGRPELALTRVEGSLREYPWSIALWLLKGELLDQAGELEKALDARREALALEPGRPDAQNAVAWTLARLGRDLDEADALIERALSTLGRPPPLLDTFATLRAAQGRYADALAFADEGLASADGDARVDLLFRRAEALAGLGRREQAEQALASALAAGAERDRASPSWRESEGRVRRLLGSGS